LNQAMSLQREQIRIAGRRQRARQFRVFQQPEAGASGVSAIWRDGHLADAQTCRSAS